MKVSNKNIDLRKIDKSSWENFRFTEIANKISETVDPKKTKLKVYVGLEHLDTDDIHIRRKDTPNQVKGGKLRCLPGDVIFGKRRAYQRKAAIIDFDGICSAHSFIFRANSDVIYNKLFPFFLHSDQFMHRMIDISVGGLSPTINWSDLKDQKFLLPPKNRQKNILELLLSINEVIERERKLIELLELNYLSIIKMTFEHTKEYVALNEIKFDYFKGLTLEENKDGKYSLIPSGAIFPRAIKEKKFKKINLKNEKDLNKILINKDILFNTGGVGTLGRSHFFSNKNNLFVCDSFVMTLRFKDKNFLNKYIYHFFQSKQIQNQIVQFTKGTTGITSINIDGIKNFKIPKLNLKEQNNVVSKFDKIENLLNQINSKIQLSKYLQKTLINKIF